MDSDLPDNLEENDKRLLELTSQDSVLSDSVLGEISQLVSSTEVDNSYVKESESNLEPNPTPESDIRQFLLKATLPQKIKLALLGNATCRGLLIRESNKMIQQCILKNPRLQSSEIEAFGKNPNLSDFILRTIASNSQWMRSYGLKCALIFNPKTPQDVSIKWVKFLNSADLRKLAKSKNVPSVVNIAARKRLADSQQG